MANNPTFHTRAFGAYSQSDMVTREGQYPDRFGQNPVQFGDDGQAFGVEADAGAAELSREVALVRDLAGRLATIHKARKAVAGNSARDALYTQAMARVREVTNLAARAANQRDGRGATGPYQRQQALASLRSTASTLRSLLAHPTGTT